MAGPDEFISGLFEAGYFEDDEELMDDDGDDDELNEEVYSLLPQLHHSLTAASLTTDPHGFT
jgi:hypothetical protein